MAHGLLVITPGERLERQEKDLPGVVAAAEEIVQEEVVKFVGPDQVLGLLGYASVVGCGHELRADRSVGDVEQHVAQFGSVAEAVVRRPDHQRSHKGLRYAHVDPVHRHVVAVVGAPAQGEFREVAGSDDYSALLAGYVHEQLRAFARLAVLVGQVVNVLVLSDVGEMLAHRREYGYFAEVSAQQLHEPGRIVVCAPAGAEAGHGHGYDVPAGQSELVECQHGHQQGQGGVQAAGDAYHRLAAADVLQTRAQARNLG